MAPGGYEGWVVVLDPPQVAVNRSSLDINNGAIVIGGASGGAGPDWGQSVISEYIASQGRWGSTVVDYTIPNRQVTIPLAVMDGPWGDMDSALAQLRQKVALFQREGGWIMRQRAGEPAMYADVVDAALTVPDVWGETGGVEPNVQLVLTTLPDFYGDEIALDTIYCTGVGHAVLQQGGAQAVVQGDHPARCRLLVTDSSGWDQRGMLWGLRSKHYDPASTAALFYEAEAMTPLNGAATGLPAPGASGGNWVSIGTLPSGSWVSMLSTDLLVGGALTHQGSYRVLARCFCYNPTQVRFIWGTGSLANPVTNDPVSLWWPGIFSVLDLGVIRLDAAPTGPNGWHGAIQVIGANFAVDCLYFQPLDEAAGLLQYTNTPPASSISTGSYTPATAVNDASIGTVPWTAPTVVEAYDGRYATVATPANVSALSELIDATAFGFSIPSGATIMGIQVGVPRVSAFGQLAYDTSCFLIKAGVVLSGVNRAAGTNIPGSVTWMMFGGPTDLWLTTWTPAQINAANFGAAYGVTLASVNNGTGVIVRVDCIAITVFYTLASGFTVAQDAVVYGNQTAEVRYDGMYRANASGAYSPIGRVSGDLARLPPSSMENRAVELFVKPSRGDLDMDIDDLGDGALDPFNVRPIYRPSWLFRP